jgi:hypothetical protein
MSSKSEDKRVVVTLLAVAFGIITTGLIIEFGLIATFVAYFGVAGAMILTLAVFWLVLVLVEYALY